MVGDGFEASRVDGLAQSTGHSQSGADVGWDPCSSPVRERAC